MNHPHAASASDFFNSLLGGLFGKADKLAKDAAERAAQEAAKASIAAARRRAVREAWRQERELVKKTRFGTYDWSDKEKQELIDTGRVKNYVGNHINSVSANPELAGVSDNIGFMRNSDHTNMHVSKGGFQVPTTGKMTDRSARLAAVNRAQQATDNKAQDVTASLRDSLDSIPDKLDSLRAQEEARMKSDLAKLGLFAAGILDAIGQLDTTDPFNANPAY